MYQNYFSIEHFMRERQRELLAEARHARPARSASRRSARRPTLFVRALAVVGKRLVIVGHRLEDRAAAAARTAAARVYEEQHPAVEC